MKTVLVTGTAGFIAHRVTRLLLEQGLEVVGVDNLNDAYDGRIKQHRLADLTGREGFTFYEGDIENLYDLTPVFDGRQFDVIFNLAARAGVRYSIENPHVYMQSNAQGALNLLEMMQQRGCGKLVLASTSSLYAGHPMPFREDLPVDRPLSPYAASKKSRRGSHLHLPSPLRPRRFHPALLHRLRSRRTPRHGPLPLHQMDPRRHPHHRLR